MFQVRHFHRSQSKIWHLFSMAFALICVKLRICIDSSVQFGICIDLSVQFGICIDVSVKLGIYIVPSVQFAICFIKYRLINMIKLNQLQLNPLQLNIKLGSQMSIQSPQPGDRPRKKLLIQCKVEGCNYVMHLQLVNFNRQLG